jgi:hypothetical protein
MAAMSLACGSGQVDPLVRWQTAYVVPSFEGDDFLEGFPVDDADAPPGTLTLEACRWRGPSRWEVDLRWDGTGPISPDNPTLVPIFVYYGIPADGYSRGANWSPYDLGLAAGVATLSANGSFTLTLDPAERRAPLGGSAFWIIQPQPLVRDGRCHATIASAGNEDSRWQELVDPAIGRGVLASLDPVSTPAPAPQTFEWVAAQSPLLPDDSESAPAVLVANVDERNPMPVDQFWLAPDLPVELMIVTFDDECIWVNTAQTDEFDADGTGERDLLVTQEHGICPKEDPGYIDLRMFHETEPTVLTESPWRVTVSGPPDLVAQVEPFPFTAGRPTSEAAERWNELVDQYSEIDTTLFD